MALQRVLSMGRKPRESYPGAIFHLIQRGINKSYIFEDTIDKKKFLEIIEAELKIFDCLFLYYVLMDNHYHLVLQTGNDSIGSIMQKINQTYARYYNNRYNRLGTIYGGRYSSKTVKTGSHFFRLLRYIAYNPVRAKMVRYPGEYSWSAHPKIANNQKTILHKKELLEFFDENPDLALRRYISCIEEPEKDLLKSISHLAKEEQHIEEYLEYLLDSMELTELDKSMVVSGSSNVHTLTIRNRFIAKAIEEGRSIKEIAEFLSISYETVRRTVKRYQGKSREETKKERGSSCLVG